MNARGLICAVAGHRWAPPADVHGPVLLLRCGRCGREQVRSAETFEGEAWGERWARAEFADEPYIDPRDIDPRIRERRH